MAPIRLPLRAARSCRLLFCGLLVAALFFAPVAVRAETATVTKAVAVPTTSPALGMSGTARDDFSGSAPGSWYAVGADISEWHLRTGVDLFELRVHDKEGAGVESIAVGALVGTGKASLEIADAFLTFGFTADGGDAVYENGAYLLDAGTDPSLSPYPMRSPVCPISRSLPRAVCIPA